MTGSVKMSLQDGWNEKDIMDTTGGVRNSITG